MTAAVAVRGTTTTTPAEGVICGAVLRESRRFLGVRQDAMADRLLVDINTYRSWEHARRPITRLALHRFKSLTRSLLGMGIPDEYVAVLDLAVEVDLAIGRALSSEENPFPPFGKCDGWHELLAWSLLGITPRLFAENPQATQPRLSQVDRACLIKRIRYAITHPDSGHDDEAMALLRRLYLEGRPLPVPEPPTNHLAAQVQQLAMQLQDVAAQLYSPIPTTGGTK
ncbi:MAG: hypothetical protein ABW156_11830 [Jiangellaceae bacterium]